MMRTVSSTGTGVSASTTATTKGYATQPKG
jgi:hypothetical protein